jgi:hypothetical protein
MFINLFNLPGLLNTSICEEKRDLYDSNGTYLQSACITLNKLSSYSRSEAYCQANEMDLFDISSNESELALLEYANDLFDGDDFYFFSVKGRDFENCQYIENWSRFEFKTGVYTCGNYEKALCAYNNSSPTKYIEEPSNFKRKLILHSLVVALLLFNFHRYISLSVTVKKICDKIKLKTSLFD